MSFTLEYLAMLGRWVHLITGIAWIGASFYFVWLDNHLTTPDTTRVPTGVGGELWAVHGGGFYNAQKYRVAPDTLPPTLHWFYWEAYSTFLSGFFLLCLLYYAQADLYLIDPRVAVLSKPGAIALSLGSIVLAWLVYDGLCKSPLARRPAWLGLTLALLLCGGAYGLCHVFSGRGAFLQFGATLGTLMVANVFFVIIPGQRQMVQAKREGRAPDPASGLRGKQRSVHNTYFTLPVLFTMVSNHYAFTFGARYNWLALIAMSAAGVLIRVYFVNRHKRHERGGRTSPWPALAGVLILGVTAAALGPRTPPSANADPRAALAPRTPPSANADPRAALGPRTPPTAAAAARFAAVQHIVAQRCVPCHAATPTQPGFSAAPQGLMFDTPEALVVHAAQIAAQVETRAMPIGNLTGMTDPERAELLDWVRQGAVR